MIKAKKEVERMHPVYELWKSAEVNKQASVEWWDAMAADFSGHERPNESSSLALRIMLRQSMIEKGGRVLDVGCGSGRFSVVLAEMGADVTGVDIAPKMIGYAQKAAGTTAKFYAEDWHTLELAAKGWEKSFDLVLAHMTPAIADAETFMKLSQASRGWCLMVKPARRTNSVYDELNELVGAPADTKALDETIAYAFSLLWDAGYSPKLDYDQQVWYSSNPLDKAVLQYTKRIEAFHALNGRQKQSIKDCLEAKAENGLVDETTHTSIVAMYWQV
jgi:SAM-dependent methyltransferase